jgi:hypothetical protein
MNAFRYFFISCVFYLTHVIGMCILYGIPKDLPTLTPWQVGFIICLCLVWSKDTKNA